MLGVMKLILLLAGAVICVTGAVVLAAPERARGLAGSITGTQRRMWGIGKILWGPAIYWAAGMSTAPVIPMGVGIVELVKGIVLLVLPDAAMKPVAAWSSGWPRSAYRLFGLLVLAIGIGMLATVRKGGGFLILL